VHEDFYRAYVDSRIAFRPQRVCRLETLVAVVGEQLRPHLSFLPSLSDFLGRTRAYCGTWVREFYSSLWIDPAHEFIHFAFQGRDRRLYNTRVREILRLPALETKIHQLCFGQTSPLRRPHGGSVPPTDLIRHCFREPFGEGSRRTPTSLTPLARVLDAIMRRTKIHQLCFGQTSPPRHPHGGPVPPTDLIRPCFHEPFGEGSRRTPASLTHLARVLDAIVRQTLLPRLGYREGLTWM
jgi:hypothetical protein